MPDLGYVVAGYLATAATLGGYLLWLRGRARRARRRTAALTGRPARR
ncbi:MAG TPA: heme exporter protein CcmD [Actinomycetota bacterium]|nr:heme exporter protein CcmD [Actinomycetota bacterium]